jgi:hypothetical protein
MAETIGEVKRLYSVQARRIAPLGIWLITPMIAPHVTTMATNKTVDGTSVHVQYDAIFRGLQILPSERFLILILLIAHFIWFMQRSRRMQDAAPATDRTFQILQALAITRQTECWERQRRQGAGTASNVLPYKRNALGQKVFLSLLTLVGGWVISVENFNKSR